MQRQRKTKDLLSVSHQQGMSRYFLGSRVSVHLMVALEDKCHNNDILLGFLSEQILSVVEYPFGPCGSAVPSMFPPKTLPPQPSGEEGMLERQH